MSVRMRINRSATGKRRSHHALSKPAVTIDGDKEKGGIANRHRVSPITGTYKGKEVIDVTKRAARSERRAKAIADSSPAIPSSNPSEEKAEEAEVKKEVKAKKKTVAKKETKKAE